MADIYYRVYWSGPTIVTTNLQIRHTEPKTAQEDES